MLQFLHKYIKAQFEDGKYDVETEEERKQYKFHKAQLYQMYYAIAKNEAENFVSLDFTLNFGIMPEVR